MNNHMRKQAYIFSEAIIKNITKNFSGKIVGSEEMNFKTIMDELSDKPKTDTKSPPKRKSCETNWAELVLPMIILYPHIKTKDDVLNNIERLKTDTRFVVSGGVMQVDLYTKDINLRKEKEISNYIINFD